MANLSIMTNDDLAAEVCYRVEESEEERNAWYVELKKRLDPKFDEEANKAFIVDLEKRPMSSWSEEETHRYSVLSGQECPNCGNDTEMNCVEARRVNS